MTKTTADPWPFKLLAIDPDGDRTVIDEYANQHEAFRDLKGHLADLDAASRGTVPALELRDWYGPHTGRRLVITGPDRAPRQLVDAASFPAGAQRAAANLLNKLGMGV